MQPLIRPQSGSKLVLVPSTKNQWLRCPTTPPSFKRKAPAVDPSLFFAVPPIWYVELHETDYAIFLDGICCRSVLLLLTGSSTLSAMEDSTRVDLQQLKARLAKLGVYIDEPVSFPGTVLGHPEQQQRASSSAVV